MRIYVPATVDELRAMDYQPSSTRWHVVPRPAHAVTAQLAAVLPGEDGEGLEFAAFLAAADECVALLAACPEAARLRLVVTVEVADDAVQGDAGVPSAVRLVREIPDVQVVCAHVDELAAISDVDDAVGEFRRLQSSERNAASQQLSDSTNALDVLAERDLLWYDWSELATISIS